MDGFGLRLLPSGFYQDYDSDCSASIFNEFATAVFRCGLNKKFNFHLLKHLQIWAQSDQTQHDLAH